MRQETIEGQIQKEGFFEKLKNFTNHKAYCSPTL